MSLCLSLSLSFSWKGGQPFPFLVIRGPKQLCATVVSRISLAMLTMKRPKSQSWIRLWPCRYTCNLSKLAHRSLDIAADARVSLPVVARLFSNVCCCFTQEPLRGVLARTLWTGIMHLIWRIQALRELVHQSLDTHPKHRLHVHRSYKPGRMHGLADVFGLSAHSATGREATEGTSGELAMVESQIPKRPVECRRLKPHPRSHCS